MLGIQKLWKNENPGPSLPIAQGCNMNNLKNSEMNEHQDGTLGAVRVLIVDADPDMRSACADMAKILGYSVRSVPDLNESRTILYGGLADVLVLHLPRGATEAFEFVSEVKLMHPQISIIVMTGSKSVYNAVEAMRRGASDYLTKPFQIDDFCFALERAAQDLPVNVRAERHLHTERIQGLRTQIVGRSLSMERLLHFTSKVAIANQPLLILGESGTGKEVIARAIHRLGIHPNQPFLPVDCSSLVRSLIESELFGYAKGSFTGALKDKEGLLIAAREGTVFLDEIGDLPLDLQAKLLRAIQEREVRPIGSSRSVPVHARIIAATHMDLPSMVEAGTFRKDLYYRLNVVTLKMPSLRHRKEDIPLLVSHFLKKHGTHKQRHVTLTRESMQMLQRYDWPGNVRELENAVERACVLADGPHLEAADFPTSIRSWTETAPILCRDEVLSPHGGKKRIQTLKELEREAIISAIIATEGDKVKAAGLLGMGKTTLYRKLHEYGMADAETLIHNG